MGQIARLAGGDVAIELGHGPHRDVVGENLVFMDQFSQPRGQTGMAADDSPHQALEGEVIEALALAVPLAGRIGQRQISRPAGLEKPLFEGDGQFLGKTGPDKTGRHDGVVVADQVDGLLGRDDLALLDPHGRYRVDHRVPDLFQVHFPDQRIDLLHHTTPL